jgi:hypothetical protein
MRKKVCIAIFVICILVVFTACTRSDDLNGQENSLPEPAVSLPITSPLPDLSQATINNGSEGKTWLTKSFSCPYDYDEMGKGIFTIQLTIPLDWSNKDAQGNTDCPVHDVYDSKLEKVLTITSVTGAADYKKFPADGVIINRRENQGNDGHDSYTIRYYDEVAKVHKYADAAVDPGQSINSDTLVTDLYALSYDQNDGLSMFVNLTTMVESTELSNVDQIVASMKLIH